MMLFGFICTNRRHGYPPQPLSNKNHKKCDELVKKRDELVMEAFFRVEKAAAAGTRPAGEDGSHGGTKARRKAGCDEAPQD